MTPEPNITSLKWWVEDWNQIMGNKKIGERVVGIEIAYRSVVRLHGRKSTVGKEYSLDMGGDSRRCIWINEVQVVCGTGVDRPRIEALAFNWCNAQGIWQTTGQTDYIDRVDKKSLGYNLIKPRSLASETYPALNDDGRLAFLSSERKPGALPDAKPGTTWHLESLTFHRRINQYS